MDLTPSLCRHAGRPAAKTAAAAFAGLLGLGLLAGTASANSRSGKHEDYVQSRPAGAPVMAVVSLARQRVTIYDADGWIMRAPVSSGQSGYETPAGIYSILQRKAEHFSNLYDDAAMPFMQRLTWSGIALHAGALPGYPASHGCVRMPHDFAERLFEVTRLGMRVIVMRDDIGPAGIIHPALFRPASGDDTAQASVVKLGADEPVVSFPNLRRVAAEKAAAAEAAASKLEQAKLTAAGKYREAAGAYKALRMAQSAKLRAEFHVRELERRLQAATEPAARAELEEARDKGLAKIEETKAALDTVQADVQPAIDGLAQVREAAQEALRAKNAADEDAREARRKIAPISVFISRASQRLYVRQAMQPLFESDVTIANADEPIGTYVFTALAYTNGEADLRWNAVSLYGGVHATQPHAKGQRHQVAISPSEARTTDTGVAKSALDRITIPEETLQRISAIVSPGSSLIVSDEPLSRETGPATEFIVVMSTEPQGGIKIRRREPEARSRYQRFMRHTPSSSGFSFW